jgi:hypothetical protein
MATLLFVALAVIGAAAVPPTMTDCTNYCTLVLEVCVPMGYNIYAGLSGTPMDNSACVDECMQWMRDETCNPTDMFPPPLACSGANTYDCRAYHTSAANTTGLVVHCNHGNPTGGDPTAGFQCVTPASTGLYPMNALDDDHCNTVMNACGTYLAADDLDSCLATYQYYAGASSSAMASPPFPSNAQTYPLNASYGTGNTIQCKRYHGQVARTAPTPHCWHATIGQEAGQAATCGSACDTWCSLQSGACGVDMTMCMTNCTGSGAPAYKGYLQSSTQAVTGNTLDCRIYHTSVAAALAVGDPLRTAHCGHGAWMPVMDTTTNSAWCVNSASGLHAPLVLIVLLAIAALFN